MEKSVPAKPNFARKHYCAVDVMRMVFCISVIFLHRASTMNNEVVFNFFVDVFSNMAVPFFSCTSVFFLFTKLNSVNDINEKNKTFWKYIKRMLLLYAIWSAIYIVPTLYNGFIAAGLSVSGVAVKYIKDLFIEGYSFIHLWYMQSLIIAVIVIYYMLKKIPLRAMQVITLFTFAVFVFTRNYTVFGEGTFLYNVFNWINTSVPDSIFRTFTEIPVYISIGITLSSKAVLSYKNYLLPFIAVQIMIIAGAILKQSNEAWAVFIRFLYPVYIWLIYQLCMGISLKPKPIYTYLRKMSALLYFVHWFVPIAFLDGLFAVTGLGYELAYNAGVRFGITIVYSVIFSVLVIKLSQKGKFKFLKYLY